MTSWPGKVLANVWFMPFFFFFFFFLIITRIRHYLKAKMTLF